MDDPSVLVVDDSATSRSVIRGVLEQRGLRVVEAATAASARQLVRSDLPCLVVLDVVLPDGSGIDLCREWREDPELVELPVLLISGERATHHDRVAGLFSGALGYLIKPFDADELIAQCLTLSALGRSQRELRLRTEELERSNEASMNFASRVAHDLKAPLNTMSVAATVLEEKALDEEGQRWIDFTHRGLARMRVLIDDLLHYARTPAMLGGKGSPIELNALASSALADLRLELDEIGGEVVIEDLPTARGHATPLRQVFQNLFENAIRYRGEAALRILVSARELPGAIEVSVEDNGLGVPEKERALIFEPLRRGKRSRGVEGTGLGLAICKSIVEGHGGELRVEDSATCGAAFRFTLPPHAETD